RTAQKASASVQTVPIMSRARRLIRGRSLGLFTQDVADAANGVDQPRLAAGLGLTSQIADVHLERVRGVVEVVTPDAREDPIARKHLARMRHEQVEERELDPRQLEFTAAAASTALGAIELEVGVAEDVLVE